MAPIRKFGHEIAHPVQFVEIFAFGCKPADTLVVAVVHHDYHIEIEEIILPNRSRTMFQIIAASRCRTAHTGVRQFAGMSRIGAGRIDLDYIGKSLPFDHAFENAVRRRRAADITEADEKYFCFHVANVVQIHAKNKKRSTDVQWNIYCIPPCSITKHTEMTPQSKRSDYSHRFSSWHSPNGFGTALDQSKRFDCALLFLRMFIGAVLTLHVIGKLQAYNAVIGEYPPLLFGDSVASFIILTALEALFAVMIMCGIWTSFAAFIMAMGMFADAFIVYPTLGWLGVERQVLYVGIYTVLVIAGGGRYALDSRFYRKKSSNQL